MSGPQKEEHSFVKRRGIPWLVCSKCGLVRFRNPITDWCVRHGCDATERPDYKSVLKSLTRQEGLS